MQKTKYFYWTAQIGGWCAYCVLIMLASYADAPEKLNFKLIFSLSMFLACAILITHLMRFVFFKIGILNLKLSSLIPKLTLISVLAALALALLNNVVGVFFEKDRSIELFSLKFLLDILSLFVLILLWNAIYFTYHFFRKTIKQELEVLQIGASQNEIELKSLRSQINPHFLFNSLNTIRALIDIEPNLAKDSVTKLSILLRKSLLQDKNPFITLRDEIELVKNYLDLEKIRFEERIEVIWNVNPFTINKEIPPFIIHAQVENAIKHGISKLVEGGRIEISINESADFYLQILILNTGLLIENPTESNFRESGIGIENTKRRLDLQYKGKATFDLFQKNESVLCEIFIKN